MSFPVYFKNGGYTAIQFRCNSGGKGTFISNDDNLSRAIINSEEFREGYVATKDDISVLYPKKSVNEEEKVVEPKSEPISVVKENFTTEPTKEEENESIPDEGVNKVTETTDKTFADVAEAKAFLVEMGVKASEIRSLKAIKEKGAELGFNITIED